MPFSLSEVVYGSVAPTIIAAGVLWLVQWLTERFAGCCSALPATTTLGDTQRVAGNRYGAVLAVASGFAVGYGSLELAPWVPNTHWHWLVYAMAAAVIAGPVTRAPGIWVGERVLLFALIASVSAWFLVPTWEDLNPSRATYLIGLVVSITVLACLLEGLASELPGPLLPALLWGTMTVAAVVLILSESLRFGQIALTAAAPFLGVTLIAALRRETNHLRGAGLLFAITSLGALMVGEVNSFSDVPPLAYYLVPIAPLTLWLIAVGPLAHATGVQRWLLVFLPPVAILGTAIALAALATQA